MSALPAAQPLVGVQVLIVEPDSSTSASLRSALAWLGAEIRQVTAAENGLSLLASETIDAAVLNADLNSECSRLLLDKLITDRVPFVLSTEFPVSKMPIEYWHLPVQEKPYCARNLASRLAAMCNFSGGSAFPVFFGPDPSRDQARAARTAFGG
jgi:hypothetical protein